MARAAIIPQSPQKRATRGRAKGTTTTTTTKSASKTASKSTKSQEPTSATGTRKRTIRTTTVAPVDSETDEETDDEIGVIDKRVREKASKSKGKPSSSSTTTRGRRAATVDVESESENEEDELAQSDAPKKRAGRPKAKTPSKEDVAKPETSSRPRGRPKGTSAKPISDADLVRENTRRNARAHESDDLSSSQLGPTEIFITTGSVISRSTAKKKKKKVTFRDLSESEADEMSEPAATTTGRRKQGAVSKDQDGFGAKPVRQPSTTTTKGRKPAATKKGGAKPLSPKKATQVAKAISSYASSDGEDDELCTAKDQIKLVVHSPQKYGTSDTGLSSPVRRINFTPGKVSKSLDENGEPNIAPAKAFDFSDSLFMSSPARRPPPSPFHFTLRETPKRGPLPLREDKKPLAQPNFTPGQESPLRTSPRKAVLGTPARGSLFRDDNGIPSQPNFTPGLNSPLKSSPRKGLFGASFLSQQQSQQSSPPFKSSLLLTPAKKVASPFKTMARKLSLEHSQPQHRAEQEEDDITPSETEQSPLRLQDMGDDTEFDHEVNEYAPESPSARDPAHESMEEDWEEEIVSESGQLVDPGGEDEAVMMEDQAENNDDMPTDGDELTEGYLHVDWVVQDIVEPAVEEIREDNVDMLPYGSDSGSEGGVEEDHEPESTPTPLDKELQCEETGLHCQLDQENEENFQSEGDLEMDEAQGSVFPASQHSLADGLEDVFTDKSPLVDLEDQGSDIAGAENVAKADQAYDDEAFVYRAHSRNDADDDLTAQHAFSNDEPLPMTELTANHSTSPLVAQPYEIEEPEDTPFVNFLLTHWAPHLPCAVEYHSYVARSPVSVYDMSSSELTPESQNDAPATLNSPQRPTERQARVSQGPSRPDKGPRFTLLAEQLSQWKASSPDKVEPRRSRRRGVFSLVGRRSSGLTKMTSQSRHSDMSKNASPVLSQLSRSEEADSEVDALDIYEDKDEQEMSGDQDLDPETLTRQPMSEIPGDRTPELPELLDDVPEETETQPSSAAENVAQTVAESSEEEKENEAIRLPAPITPMKSRIIPTQTFHTVSKVPLKPEGQISPLKMCRKRGRSLSITSPIRSSPRLRKPSLSSNDEQLPVFSPRKSRRIQQASARLSQIKEKPCESVETQQTRRPRTPSRAASPSKTPRTKVSASEQCLRGAVVYVDVHTTEGEDASGIFIELLQQMGARCIKSWSWNPRLSLSPVEGTDSKEHKVGITHVVFKDGGVRTLEKVRHAAGVVKCVGVGWVLDCERENKWLDESQYAVDSSIIPRGGAKRRKSMEPRALSNVNGTLVKTSMAGSSSASTRRSGVVRSTTPISQDDASSTAENTPKYKGGHAESDQKYLHTPKTPGSAAYAFNMDSIGMSPATPFYLSQRSKLVQQTCPPKQTREGLFSRVGSEDYSSQKLKSRLEAARRKSLAFKPAIGSPLVE